MRIIFAGTPDFAATALNALLACEHQVVAVLTQPDRKAGRGKKLKISAVKRLAMNSGIEVYQPLSFKDAAVREQISRLNPDVMIVAAYGLLLPQAVLNLPRFGCINIHASLLPRWRGAAPIQRAIEAGDADTGISIMKMDAGLDTGDVIMSQSMPIKSDDTSLTLHARLAELGADMIVSSLDQLQNGLTQVEPQNELLATYAVKLKRSEAGIDWRQTCRPIIQKIHALNPWPVATCEYQGQQIKLLRARIFDANARGNAGEILCAKKQLIVQTGLGQIELLECQKPGSKAMSVEVFLNGFKLEVAQFLR